MSLTRHLATAAFGALALAACGAPGGTPGESVPEDAGYAAPPELRTHGLPACRIRQVSVSSSSSIGLDLSVANVDCAIGVPSCSF